MEDWNAYAGDVPTALCEMADLAKTALTFDGKLALLASPPNPAIWAFKIRTDWLANLGREVPATPESCWRRRGSSPTTTPTAAARTTLTRSLPRATSRGSARSRKLRWGVEIDGFVD